MLQAVDHALSAGADRFSQNDIERVTSLQKALRLKPAEVQVQTCALSLHPPSMLGIFEVHARSACRWKHMPSLKLICC